MPTCCSTAPGPDPDGDIKGMAIKAVCYKFYSKTRKSEMILARTLYDLHTPMLCQIAGTFKRLCMPTPPPIIPPFYTWRKMRPKAKKTQLDGENSETTA